MAVRSEVTKTRRKEAGPREFQFTKEMLPAVHADGKLPASMAEYQEKAWAEYTQLSLPTSAEEPWRRTDLKGMRVGDFRLPMESDASALPRPPAQLLEPLTSDQHGGQVLLGPGDAEMLVDPALTAQGVIFTDFASAQRQYPQIVSQIMGKVVGVNESKFSAMAAALGSRGVLLFVPKGVQVEQPLHSLLWGPGVDLSYLSHLLVWVDDGASVTYVHESASPTAPGGQALHSGIVEILVGKEARLRFVELQSWGEHVWNFTHERARVERDGNLDWTFGAIGSHLTKNFSELELVGQGATGRMSGFYFTDGNQHLDHDTQQNHLAPHTTSDLLFKGALKDQSRSVWQGMIYVAPGAQKTDGYQANRNLVLSKKARADSIPGLEILADDVRCTHGATVGKIDADQVFYLRSRGIPADEAERLIVEGFFDPIMQRIPFEGVRERFQQAILEKMS